MSIKRDIDLQWNYLMFYYAFLLCNCACMINFILYIFCIYYCVKLVLSTIFLSSNYSKSNSNNYAQWNVIFVVVRVVLTWVFLLCTSDITCLIKRCVAAVEGKKYIGLPLNSCQCALDASNVEFYTCAHYYIIHTHNNPIKLHRSVNCGSAQVVNTGNVSHNNIVVLFLFVFILNSDGQV